MDTDQILDELKKLREGRGLRADRLAESPALIDAIALDDPAKAKTALGLLIGNLGDGDRVRALKVDFGLELEELLGRRPTTREIDFLGDRRAAYAEVIGRDVKTLSRWSTRTLKELQAQFVAETYRGHVIVTAGVQNNRLAGIDVITFERDDETRSQGQSTAITNPADGPSLPAVIYGIPYGWEPASLTFIVMFLDETPERIWAVVADSLANVSFAHERTELTLDGNVAKCRIDEPDQGLLYGVWWQTAL